MRRSEAASRACVRATWANVGSLYGTAAINEANLNGSNLQTMLRRTFQTRQRLPTPGASDESKLGARAIGRAELAAAGYMTATWRGFLAVAD
jgi:hypothetical protein